MDCDFRFVEGMRKLKENPEQTWSLCSYFLGFAMYCTHYGQTRQIDDMKTIVLMEIGFVSGEACNKDLH